MTTENLKIWDAIEATDPNFTKKLDNGKFKGTSVNPTYNIKRVTEQLGPVGFKWGWKVKSERLDTFETDRGPSVVHVLTLTGWFAQDDGTIREVDAIGCTPYFYPTNKGGAMLDNEAPKKSQTDALSKLMMALGASADIWLAYYDDADYVRERKREAAEREEEGEDREPPRRQRSEPANDDDGEDDPARPLTIVDPAGKKPASKFAFDKAAGIMENWAKGEKTKPEAILAVLTCNREEIGRIPGLAEALEAIAAEKRKAA